MLDSLHIKNFRCFEDLTIPSLGRINLIVGKNNSGKSTLLEAISIFVSGKDMTADDEYHATELISQMRKILVNRNAFFHEEKTPSDIAVFIESLFNKKELRIKFEDISKTNILEIYPYPTSINPKKFALYFSTNEDQKTIINLDENLNLDKSWQESYLDFLESKTHQDNDDDNSSLTLDSILAASLNKSLRVALHIKKFRFIPSGLIAEDALSYLWDAIDLNNQKSKILEVLSIILPNISDLSFPADQNTKERAAFIKENGDSKSKPIKAMGEGTSRLLQLFLYAFLTRKGYLLIDEFENGLHYSIQEEVWDKLFKLAKELDIQVFATTHSEDTVKAFCKVSLADDEVDGKLISLGRSAAIADNGKILADVYDEKTLAWIVQSGMEVR